jgi:hypothetical protein
MNPPDLAEIVEVHRPAHCVELDPSHGLRCGACDWTSHRESTGDITAKSSSCRPTGATASPHPSVSERRSSSYTGNVMPNSGPAVAVPAHANLPVAFPGAGQARTPTSWWSLPTTSAGHGQAGNARSSTSVRDEWPRGT